VDCAEISKPPKSVAPGVTVAREPRVFEPEPPDGGGGGVVCALTVWLRTFEDAGALFESPEYDALIWWVPSESEAVDVLAAPPATATGVPKFEFPSLNCTVPVGLLPPDNVAMKVTLSP